MFYTDLNARDFQATWNLLSPQYQGTLAFNTWVSGYGTTQSVQLLSASISSQDGAHATVDICLAATDNTDTGVHITHYQGTWELIFANGLWKLGNPSIRQVP